MTERMQIAVEAMKALLQKDFKNIGFSAYNSGQSSPASYIANQSFDLADAMIAAYLKKDESNDKD